MFVELHLKLTHFTLKFALKIDPPKLTHSFIDVRGSWSDRYVISQCDPPLALSRRSVH